MEALGLEGEISTMTKAIDHISKMRGSSVSIMLNDMDLSVTLVVRATSYAEFLNREIKDLKKRLKLVESNIFDKLNNYGE